MRGIAILLVFLVHWSLGMAPHLPGGLWRTTFAAAFAAGNTGVDLFFALSGFLIYDHLLSRAVPFATFLWHRAWRIYPTFLAVFALYLLLSLLRPEFAKLPAGGADAAWYLIRCFLLLPGIVQEAPLVGVAWSLSYEIAFYIFLPIFIWLFGLRERSTAGRCRVIGVLALAIVLFAAGTELHERLIMFPAGMLAREVVIGLPSLVRSRLYAYCAAGVFTSTFVLIALFRTAWPFANPSPFTAVACAITCFAGFGVALPSAIQKGGPLAGLARLKPLRWMGEISYSYYLLHNIVLKAVLLALTRIWPETVPFFAWIALTPVVFVATLVPGVLLYKIVERPSLKYRPFKRRPTLKDGGFSRDAAGDARRSDTWATKLVSFHRSIISSEQRRYP